MHMKKIIITMLMIGCFATTSIFAYEYNLQLNTDQYVSLINTNIAEMTAEIEANKQKATLGTLFFDGGLEEGYVKPSIKNDTLLKNCVSGLIDNIKDTKIIDKKLQSKHNELMDLMQELTVLLDDTIKCKDDILKSNDNKMTKARKILLEDENILKEVNSKIEEINKVYIQINNFNKNVA